MKYGARHLKRAIERHVVYPLASLLATEQVSLGDVISIDWHGGELGLTFLKEAEGAMVPMASPVPERFAEVGDEARRAIHAGRAGATTANAWKSGGDKLKWFEAKALPPSELAAW
jgi:hypothetical protein